MKEFLFTLLFHIPTLFPFLEHQGIRVTTEHPLPYWLQDVAAPVFPFFLFYALPDRICWARLALFADFALWRRVCFLFFRSFCFCSEFFLFLRTRSMTLMRPPSWKSPMRFLALSLFPPPPPLVVAFFPSYRSSPFRVAPSSHAVALARASTTL